MPIYEYKCEKCERIFERWSNKIRDSEWTEICPHDGGVGKRIISQSTFVLKGAGWAKDGYEKHGQTSGKQKQKGNNGSSD